MCNTTEPGSSMFAIGAPTAAALPSQPLTSAPGGVYSCPYTTQRQDCARVQVDGGGSTVTWNKTDEWLGVAMKSQGRF